MNMPENVGSLVEEYQVLFRDISVDSPDHLEGALTRQAEWSDEAAAHLLELARNYGWFMLRNALAIALALGVEDGELGF